MVHRWVVIQKRAFSIVKIIQDRHYQEVGPGGAPGGQASEKIPQGRNDFERKKTK